MKKLKVGMIGGGGEGAFFGRVHEKAICLDGTREIAAGALRSSPDASLAEADEWGIQGYPDYRAMIAAARSGDLELWSMNSDGGELKQLTNIPGYDGGAFFSRDGSKLVWRASRFDDPAEEAEYFKLLGEGIIRPSHLEIFVADSDGNNVMQLTDNGAANFGPFFTHDGGSVIFSSNMADPEGRVFELWKVSIDGKNLEQITRNGESFDGFPMFSPCGRYLVFASNRNGKTRGDTNLFVCEWAN